MPQQTSRLDEGLLTGVAAFRSLTWIWAAIALVAYRDSLAEPNLAYGLLAAAGALTAFTAINARSNPTLLLHPATIVTELGIAFLLVAADSRVYEGERLQSLGSAWPLSGVLTAGIAAGPRGGVLAGAVLALGRAVSVGAEPTLQGAVAAGSAGMLYILGGWAAGFAAQKLRDAEAEIASAKARSEVADELHDGVLQTLAAVQRRSDDPGIVRLARSQERRLRNFLAGTATRASNDLVESLQATIASFEQTWETRVELVVIDIPESTEPNLTQVVSRATGEALTNAAKHGGANRSTVCLDVDADTEELTVSIHDDGAGFDPAAVAVRGMNASMKGPVVALGGTLTVTSSAEGGTDVEMRLPVDPRRDS